MKKYCLILISYFLIQNVECHGNATLDAWENYIYDEMDRASNYQPPSDNQYLRPDNKRDEIPRDYGTYDFIIVGAGSAGSVIANRLSEIKKWKILLLEAGEWPTEISKIPSLKGLSLLSSADWGYHTVPQKNSCQGMPNNECPYCRGKVVGGSSISRALIYSRGDCTDFNRLEKLGNPGWSFKDVLPYFKKSERILNNTPYPVINPRYHGSRGDWDVQFGYVSNQTKVFIRANEELGYPLTDINSPRPSGVSPLPINSRHGVARDAARTFILPILYRRNFKILINSLVTKILIHERSKRASGVKFVRNGKTYYATARKEVIISAGVINTPQLLMLSGIGPRNHLRKFGIPIIKDLAVGSALRDHPMYFGLSFSSNSSSGQTKPFREYIRQWINGKGPLLNPSNIQGMSLHHSSYQDKSQAPDIELLFGAANCTSDLQQKMFAWSDEINDALFSGLDRESCFTIYPIILDVKSKGSVRLRSRSPFDFPLIDPKYLCDSRDFNKMFEAIQLALKLTETKAFKSINARLYPRKLKACSHFDFMCEDYIKCTIRQLTSNVWNSVGTCPMGPDRRAGAVVDHKLRVHGVKRLRVADSSVLPLTLGGSANTVSVMIGEKLSDVIKWHHRSRF